jgi:DNA-binding MarR family transcriptional regulator
MSHPRHGLDVAFQTPIRFSLMAALGSKTEIDFATLRDLLEVDDSVLSKAASYLEKAGYLRVTKGYVGNRPRTWIASTAKGHRAYRDHLLALRAITAGILDA